MNKRRNSKNSMHLLTRTWFFLLLLFGSLNLCFIVRASYNPQGRISNRKTDLKECKLMKMASAINGLWMKKFRRKNRYRDYWELQCRDNAMDLKRQFIKYLLWHSRGFGVLHLCEFFIETLHEKRDSFIKSMECASKSTLANTSLNEFSPFSFRWNVTHVVWFMCAV